MKVPQPRPPQRGVRLRLWKGKKEMDLFRNKWVTVFLCSYEITAVLASKDKLPTITRLVRRHPTLGVALTGAMGWHFVTARQGNPT